MLIMMMGCSQKRKGSSSNYGNVNVFLSKRSDACYCSTTQEGPRCQS